MTLRSRPEAPRGTYVVCLDCGKEFAYSWEEMRIVNELRRTRRSGNVSVAVEDDTRELTLQPAVSPR